LFTISTPTIVTAVRCNIDILVGVQDKVAPYQEHARLLQEAVPRARTHLFDGCGHILKLEAPARFNAIIRESLVPT
jgi:pimeloyl-ACP methyl ester carboxylesterase